MNHNIGPDGHLTRTCPAPIVNIGAAPFLTDMGRIVQHRNEAGQHIELQQVEESIIIGAFESPIISSDISVCMELSLSEAKELALDLLDLIDRARKDAKDLKAHG